MKNFLKEKQNCHIDHFILDWIAFVFFNKIETIANQVTKIEKLLVRSRLEDDVPFEKIFFSHLSDKEDEIGNLFGIFRHEDFITSW